MTFMINIGRYGGFYAKAGRICLGWIAFSLMPYDLDPKLEHLVAIRRAARAHLADWESGDTFGHESRAALKRALEGE